jgi:hypothetical protein
MSYLSAVRVRVVPVLVVVCALGLVGLGIAGAGRATDRAAHRHPQRQTRRRAPTVKPQIVGLVDKSSQSSYVLRQPFGTVNVAQVSADAAAFSAIVVNETWAQLEPRQGHFTFRPLRRSLAAVAAYHHAHPDHQLAVKLRFWGGFTAPGWAKQLGGVTPVTFATPGAAGTTGRWWTTAYRAQWSAFQHRLAAGFDDDPLIRSVAVSSCATLTAEPFVQSPNLDLHEELFADGWSSAAQEACLRGAFSDYSGWTHTPIDYSFNPFVTYTPGNRGGAQDLAFMNSVMATCAGLLHSTGRSCILSNHAFTASAPTESRSAPTYTEIKALYAEHPGQTPVDLQTGPPDNFGGCQAINTALGYHAQSLELWPPAASARSFKGFSAYPKSELLGWARAFRTRDPLSC